MSSRIVHPSSCDWVHPQLPAYVDGELGSAASQQVSAHLDRCGRCRRSHQRQVQEVTETIQNLGRTPDSPESEIPNHLIETVMASIPRSMPATAEKHRPRLWEGLRPAAALLLALCLWALVSPSPDPVVKDPVAATSTAVELLRGDIDANGRFELSDLRQLVGYLQEDHTQELACIAAGDFDENGVITLEDSVIAAQTLTGHSSATSLASTLVTIGADSALSCEGVCP